ncbi:ABC transporter substrate-binding protein [Xanthobacter sp. V4C-4]|uniref:ABC transporter substrate-binding protein n=1 Tax=Xanthobacter cornucopiae TaxID=3119924 RepID=UPI00372C50B8
MTRAPAPKPAAPARDRGRARARLAATLLLAASAWPAAAAEAERTAPQREQGAGPVARATPPRRIVSLNLCADELVLRLAPKGAVVSVTTLAGDPVSSTVVDLAAGLPTNRGLAEEVVPLAPDLVIAGAFTTRNTVSLLQRFGIEVMEMTIPNSLDEAYAQIRAIAERLGVPEKGEAMLREIEAAIAAAPPPPGPRPRAVVMRPNGFTVGRDSLPDDLMRRAGLDNMAARLSPDKLGQLSLEEIITARPDVLVVDDEPDAPPSLARELMRHPAVAEAVAGGHIAPMPLRLWACVGPQLAEAFARLSAAARAAAGDAVATAPAMTRTR